MPSADDTPLSGQDFGHTDQGPAAWTPAHVIPPPHSLCLHFTPLQPSREALTCLPPGMQSIPPGPPGPVAGWQPFSGFSGDPRAAGGHGAGCATIILEKHPGPLRGPGRALGWVRETLTTWLAVLPGLHSRAACARAGTSADQPGGFCPLLLWSPCPSGAQPTGSPSWKPRPMEPRQLDPGFHGAPPPRSPAPTEPCLVPGFPSQGLHRTWKPGPSLRSCWNRARCLPWCPLLASSF